MSNIKINDKEIPFVSPALLVSALFLILFLIVLFLYQRGLIALPETISKAINSILLVSITMFVVTVFSRLTKKYVYKFFEEPEEQIFYSKIYSWSLFAIGMLVILNHFGVSLANITLFIGLMATGLAFAIRDVLIMIFAWMILLRKKPFRIGDYIKIGEDEGKVQHIGTFYVLLDKTHELPEDFIRVPNRIFLEKSVNNLGKNNFYERIKFRLRSMPNIETNSLLNLQNQLKNIIERHDHLGVFVDIVDEKLILMVEYVVDFDRRQAKRSLVVEKVLQEFSDIIVFPNV
ncbi:MAG TPA: hypothetical protein DCM62_03505 [Bacteroidales bacterium]|nr:hypothetical protein [Bacteroidales bacterium]